MNKHIIKLSLIAVLSVSAFAGGEFISIEQTVNSNDAIMAEIEALKGEIDALKAKKDVPVAKTDDKFAKKLKALNKKLNKVKAHDAYDNIKFSVDFRNTYDNLHYKNHNTGDEADNDSLLSSRLILNMKSAPTKNLTFYGQLAAYSTWGAHLFGDSDPSFKSWAASSKASDTLFRVKQAYFVYSDDMADGKLPYAFSIGRRQSTDGFLANHRENLKDSGSPLAHITNMEVDGAMFKLNTEKYLTEGSFIKFIYGRAHSGGIDEIYGDTPYAQEDGDVNENVDFLIALGSLYNNGQYNLMFEDALILNTKGARTGTKIGAPLADGSGKNKSLDAGKANLMALSLQVDGVGDEINDFLDETTLFASVAATQYTPDSGHELLGSTSDKTGSSVWVGVTFPDMITDAGRFGLEYNKGSKYWTPMTWAEDTAMGSKLAVRGDAYEAYWNFNLFGAKNLPSQIRYTHAQHDYTPNNKCQGWVAPKATDITADDIRVFVSYKY